MWRTVFLRRPDARFDQKRRSVGDQVNTNAAMRVPGHHLDAARHANHELSCRPVGVPAAKRASIAAGHHEYPPRRKRQVSGIHRYKRSAAVVEYRKLKQANAARPIGLAMSRCTILQTCDRMFHA